MARNDEDAENAASYHDIHVEELRRKSPPWYCSTRYGLSCIAFFGFVVLYALRVDMSVAMVCMVNHTALKTPSTAKAGGMNVSINGTGHTYYLGNNSLNHSTLIQMSLDLPTTRAPTGKGDNDKCGLNEAEARRRDGPFVWDETTQARILSGFFYGYLVTQIPGGWLASKYGGKWVFGGFMLAASISTLLMPMAANIDYRFLIALRVICGLGSGVAFPSMHAFFASWAPPLERSKLLNIAYAGTQVGIVVTTPLSGILCEEGFAGGWGSIFYILGGFGVVWCFAWFILANNSPAQHPRISEDEKDYIMGSLQGQIDHAAEKRKMSKKINVPWKAMFLSMPVWAIIVANVVADWGAYTFLTNIPTYINDVLKFDYKANGALSALPYICFWFVIVLTGFLADKIRSAKWLSTGMTRKVLNTVGMIGPVIFLISLGFVDCTKPALAMALLTIGISITGCVWNSYTVNHVDIAPQYAGILFGISNTVASVTGIASPEVVGAVRSSDLDKTVAWRVIFVIASAVYLFGAIFYFIFASGEIQPWAQDLDSSPELPEEVPLSDRKEDAAIA